MKANLYRLDLYGGIMRVVSLCSSSKANCTYIEDNGKGILVDVGCSFKALKSGLESAGRSLSDVSAVVITHEHSDHIGGLLQLTKHTDIPVYASEGTLSGIITKGKADPNAILRNISELENAPTDIRITAFPTPHDTPESNGYTFTSRGKKIAVCTDLGHVTEEVRSAVLGSRFVLLESNYDLQMLIRNLTYPPELKARIRSDRGHLSNGDSASFARELIASGTVSLLLGHLSEKNNTPEIAYNNMISALRSCGAEVNRDYLLGVAAVFGNGKGISV